MSSIKRRLIYVADESESVLQGLSGTPPMRPSRLSFLPPISSSPELSGDEGEGDLAKGALQVDPSILISYDGFLLVDGSGKISVPRNEMEAVRILDALRSCSTFLREYLHQNASSDDAGESSSSFSSSELNIFTEEEEEEEEEDNSWRKKSKARGKRTQRRPPAKKQRPPRQPPRKKETPHRGEVDRGAIQANHSSDVFGSKEGEKNEELTSGVHSSHPQGWGFPREEPVDSGRGGLWGAIASVGSLLFRSRSRASTGVMGERNTATPPRSLAKRPRSA
ncbi:unnamed protein product [Phytomonas sp. EM1]|nr:unnamed protein product [Phytomonas sp. EM1]|eukprot:CCW59904.1 unnamed protein product [Phytomonas sp. isolate EM1]